jgi:hypothetical protein
MEKNIQRAQEYCREAVDLWPDVIPIAPHVYCTQFLDDTNQTERAVGMDIGISLLDLCDEIWVYGIENPSEGMKAEIEYAQANEIPIRDAADVYKLRKELDTLTESLLGDVLLKLPGHVSSLNGVAVRESTSVCLSGDLIEQLAKELRRNRGNDLIVDQFTEAES